MKGGRYTLDDGCRVHGGPARDVSNEREEVAASVSLERLSLARGGQIASPVSSDVLKSYVIFP